MTMTLAMAPSSTSNSARAMHRSAACGTLGRASVPRAVRAASRLAPARAVSEDVVQMATGFGAVVGGGAVARFVQGATDPEVRRQQMADEAGGDELRSVGDYFSGEGFQRWRRIYDDEAEDVNKVQKDIREGHAKTIDIALEWFGQDLDGVTVCDAGCGTGSLTIPLALRGAKVSASDISAPMAEEAGRRYEAAAQGRQGCVQPNFEAKDLERLSGSYDTVACLDVMIHYPDSKMEGMVGHLASMAQNRMIISFAPKTPYYSFLKRVGELFPGKSKATRAYLHAEEDVERALVSQGFRVVKRDMTATNFYFSRILEAVRV